MKAIILFAVLFVSLNLYAQESVKLKYTGCLKVLFENFYILDCKDSVNNDYKILIQKEVFYNAEHVLNKNNWYNLSIIKLDNPNILRHWIVQADAFIARDENGIETNLYKKGFFVGEYFMFLEFNNPIN